jgi:adhesin transport system outer membrane protein
VELAELALKNAKSSILLEGLTAHFSLIRDKKLLDYAKQAENFIKQQLKLENEKVEKGSGIELDILQAKSRLQLVSQRKIQFRGQLEQAIARFSYLFKYRPILTGAVNSDFELPEIPSALDEVLSVTLRNSAAIQSAQSSADVSKLGLKAARSGYWPNLNLEGSYNFERDAGGVEGIRRDWAVLLKASWTLFDGLNTYNGARAARSNYAAALSQFDTTKKQVEADIAIGLQQLKTSIENKDLVANGLKIAEEIVVARERLAKAGKETSINTLDAQIQLIDAKINYTLAYYEQKITAFNVIFNMGLLSVEK